VNTGWSGGAYGVGSRMKLAYTRAIIDAIHSGELAQAATIEDPYFGLAVPATCPGVPASILQPANVWSDRAAYDNTGRKLARLFVENFSKYAGQTAEEIAKGGPKIA
jgi:phosphoenolpyruvate carboxykinase (ATP)